MQAQMDFPQILQAPPQTTLVTPKAVCLLWLDNPIYNCHANVSVNCPCIHESYWRSSFRKKKKGSKREVGHFKESRHHVTNQKSININKINVCHMGLLPAWNPSLQHKRYSVAQSLDKKKKSQTQEVWTPQTQYAKSQIGTLLNKIDWLSVFCVSSLTNPNGCIFLLFSIHFYLGECLQRYKASL